MVNFWFFLCSWGTSKIFRLKINQSKVTARYEAIYFELWPRFCDFFHVLALWTTWILIKSLSFSSACFQIIFFFWTMQTWASKWKLAFLRSGAFFFPQLKFWRELETVHTPSVCMWKIWRGDTPCFNFLFLLIVIQEMTNVVLVIGDLLLLCHGN